jgi:MFS family permease
MALVGAGILWATQVPAHGHFWANLASPLFLAGGAAFAFIPVSIGALAGVTDHDAGIASGLLNTSQQIGGAIGVAVASTVAATHSRLLLSQGHAAAAALTGGFQWAFWVTGLTGLAAVPVTFLLIRRTGASAAHRGFDLDHLAEASHTGAQPAPPHEKNLHHHTRKKRRSSSW